MGCDFSTLAKQDMQRPDQSCAAIRQGRAGGTEVAANPARQMLAEFKLVLFDLQLFTICKRKKEENLRF